MATPTPSNNTATTGGGLTTPSQSKSKPKFNPHPHSRSQSPSSQKGHRSFRGGSGGRGRGGRGSRNLNTNSNGNSPHLNNVNGGVPPGRGSSSHYRSVGGGRNQYRRGGGRGRGSGRGSRGGGGRGNVASPGMSDEDVMIAFMHYLRSDDPKAKQIYSEFGGKQRIFVEAVRDFLKEKESDKDKESNHVNSTATSSTITPKSSPNNLQNTAATTFEGSSTNNNNTRRISNNGENHETTQRQASIEKSPSPARKEQALRNADGVPESQNKYVVEKSIIKNHDNQQYIQKEQQQQQEPEQQQQPNFDRKDDNSYHTTLDGSKDQEMEQMVACLTVDDTNISSLAKATKSSTQSIKTKAPPAIPVQAMHATSTETTSASSLKKAAAPQLPTPQPPSPSPTSAKTSPGKTTPAPTPAPASSHKWQPKRILTRPEQQPGRILANNIEATTTGLPHISLGPRRELVATWKLPLTYLRERTLKRLQTAAADGNGNGGGMNTKNLTVRDALRSLTVGLFRRGCAENGASSSIISKEVVPSDVSEHHDGTGDGTSAVTTTNRAEYHFEINEVDGSIWGTVPFYTPRTPGNVVLRLYFEDDPLITLATSQCIRVIVKDDDVEPTLRFVLSNFKAKKGTTNFSSIHSLAAVLEQFSAGNIHNQNQRFHQSKRNDHANGRQHHGSNNHFLDGAGRAAWGCICESRKVLEASRSDFLKKKDKLIKQEEELISVKEEVESRSNAGTDDSIKEEGGDENDTKIMTLDQWKEKMNSLMGERASNERKWREVQSAFASVLRAVLFNSSSPMLLKRDIITKLRLEFELWCPLCESFAQNPFRNDEESTGSEERISPNFPFPINNQHFALCQEKRADMQMEILGFVPKVCNLHQIQQRDAHKVYSKLSSHIETTYKDVYMTTLDIHKKREDARSYTESLVSRCDAFPNGTRVVIFGSSANGFGSPKSDLDMCIQLPPSSSLLDKDDANGSSAMAKLAEQLEEAGMVDVDTCRLTARIPVVMFKCLIGSDDQDQTLIECDLSMQNPLACLNTALLRSYSNLMPEVRMLASVIKRWAKSRKINDPSHHTLSSYGYIIMLLHFLTTHKATTNGLIVPVYSSGNNRKKNYQYAADCPLIPNLQWVDQRWLKSPVGTPYQEWNQKPCNQYSTMVHPTEQSFIVNTYFYRLTDEASTKDLHKILYEQKKQGPSLAIILAGFFRYYAYEFDYKKHIITINSPSLLGLVEREAKAESDSWKLYGQALCIEDPFETFYDVAHVLKPSNFQRTRREFALAYSKIANATSLGRHEPEPGKTILDHLCESIPEKE